MTLTQTSEPTPQPTNAEFEVPLPPTDLIFDDGEPLESNRHRIAMNVLIRSLKQKWSDRTDFFTGGNMFIYYSAAQVRNQDFRGPDFFVVLNVDGTTDRQGWVSWLEGGRYPDVIVEFLSPSTAGADVGAKKDIYEQVFRTRDYFVFDPFNANSLQGWRLDPNLHYQPLNPNDRAWFWCDTLGLWLGVWQGEIEGVPADWLRFYDQQGELVLLPEEAEKSRAEAEKARAEAEKSRAEAEKSRADRLAAKLQELGINPDEIA